MKKFLSLILALSFLLTFAACSKEEAKEETIEEGAISGVANPMTEISSIEELSEIVNGALTRIEGATNEKYFTYAVEPIMAEYQFDFEGFSCRLRFSKADITQDISGVYVDDGTAFEGATDEDHYITNDDCKLHRWFTSDGQYILIVDDEEDAMSFETFEKISNTFQSLEPLAGEDA